MAVLLLADVAGGALSVDQTAKALSAVKDLGPVTILVCGPSEAAAEAAKMEGAAKVLHAGDALYGAMLAEPTAGLVASLAGDYEHIASPSTANGKNILPRAAALLDVMVISDITAVKGADSFERPIYAGNALQVVKTADAKKVFTIRTAGFGAAGMGGSAPVEAVSAAADPALSSFVEDKVQASDRPDLTSAKIVISGGRGIGSKENFAIVEKVADKLGAAVGISGAIQHLAGMKDSKVIVAINKDEEAPIFQLADYGLVADLFTAVPELTEKL